MVKQVMVPATKLEDPKDPHSRRKKNGLPQMDLLLWYAHLHMLPHKINKCKNKKRKRNPC